MFVNICVSLHREIVPLCGTAISMSNLKMQFERKGM